MTPSVWNHFVIDPNDSNYTVCNYCGIRLSRGGQWKSPTTSPLNWHSRLKHSVQFENLINQKHDSSIILKRFCFLLYKTFYVMSISYYM